MAGRPSCCNSSARSTPFSDSRSDFADLHSVTTGKVGRCTRLLASAPRLPLPWCGWEEIRGRIFIPGSFSTHSFWRTMGGSRLKVALHAGLRQPHLSYAPCSHSAWVLIMLERLCLALSVEVAVIVWDRRGKKGKQLESKGRKAPTFQVVPLFWPSCHSRELTNPQCPLSAHSSLFQGFKNRSPNPPTLSVGMWIGAVTMENSMEVP